MRLLYCSRLTHMKISSNCERFEVNIFRLIVSVVLVCHEIYQNSNMGTATKLIEHKKNTAQNVGRSYG